MQVTLTFHDKLVRPRHKRQTIVVVKGLANVLAKGIASAARRYTPSTAVVWVRPQEITHWSLMRNLLHTINSPNMVQGVDGGRKATVQTENLSRASAIGSVMRPVIHVLDCQ